MACGRTSPGPCLRERLAPLGPAGRGGAHPGGRAAPPRGALRSGKDGAASSPEPEVLLLPTRSAQASSARRGVKFTPCSHSASSPLQGLSSPGGAHSAWYPRAPGRPRSILLPHLPGRPSLHRRDTLSQTTSASRLRRGGSQRLAGRRAAGDLPCVPVSLTSSRGIRPADRVADIPG